VVSISGKTGTVFRVSLALTICTLIECPTIFAFQVKSVASPQFNAASLKLAADQNIFETRPRRSAGRFRWNTSLLYMLSYAYHMELWRISETPELHQSYVLDATMRPSATQDDVRLMLEGLLIERFHFVVHRETRTVAEGYTLTVAKGGPKLVQAKPDGPESDSAEFDDGYVIATSPAADSILLRGDNASMLQLAEWLQRMIGTSVLDRTNLAGRYDFELACTSEGAQSSPYLLASCVKRVGLVMGKYKGPVEFLVIDHVGTLVEN
jgi:uncharacterized protein (TIGR03435 family)